MSDPTKLSPPTKPYPTFPLTAHSTGKYCKRIRGKTYYFGKWAKKQNGKLVRVPGDGWRDALDKYKEVADDLHAGRTPTKHADGLTVGNLVDEFLNHKGNQHKAGELKGSTLNDYQRACDRLKRFMGERLVIALKPNDFAAFRVELAENWGPWTLSGEIQRIRTVFKYAFDAELIDKPVRFGPGFQAPSKSTMRKHRASGGKKLFSREEVQTLLDSTKHTMRAFVLLGINCGLNNSDCCRLEFRHLDLENGWLDFPRPKTGIDRRAKLWVETIEAIKAVQRLRPKAKNRSDSSLVFLRPEGTPYTTVQISGRIATILAKHSINGRRGLNFTALRHTFRTIADGSKDFPAVRLVMGHVDATIDGVYREEISDDRLAAVADYVRSWLFGEKPSDELCELAPNAANT